MPYEKSIEEYRRDIFALKTKLKEQEKYLEEIKQKYSDVDIFGQEKSYSLSLKLKILEYNLNAVKENMDKYKKDEAYDFYAINFATLALLKSTEVLMINREMVFRAIDTKCQGKVTAFDFSSFLKETLKLNDDFIKPIVEILDPQNKGVIKKQRYKKYLECFLMNTEQDKNEVTSIEEACENIAKQILVYNNLNMAAPINPQLIWKAKEINIAILGQGLLRKIPTIDRLDCIGLYCKLDPSKKGFLETRNVVDFLVKKINDVKAFGVGTVKLQK